MLTLAKQKLCTVGLFLSTGTRINVSLELTYPLVSTLSQPKKKKKKKSLYLIWRYFFLLLMSCCWFILSTRFDVFFNINPLLVIKFSLLVYFCPHTHESTCLSMSTFFQSEFVLLVYFCPQAHDSSCQSVLTLYCWSCVFHRHTNPRFVQC